MDLGRGLLVPPDNNIEIGGHWVPLTPGRPMLLGSNGIPIERQGNQAGRSNWNELADVQHLQAPMNYKGDSQDFNIIGLMEQRGGSYNLGAPPTQTGSFDYIVGSSDIAVWDNNPLAELFALKKNASPMASGNRMSSNRNIQETNAPTILNTYSKVDSSWTEANFTSLLLGGECPNLSHWTNADSQLQRPQDGFPIPSLPKFNLNSPPRSETDATSSASNSFPFATVTPVQTNQFESHRHSDMLNFSVEESSTQEKDKLDNLLTSMGGKAIENYSNELLQNIVDSSSAAVSNQLNGKIISEDGDQGIDLNKTPQQKTPKRRKHRPRVVAEGKPKRTPKVKTPNTGYGATTSGKRKYVQKKSLEATAGTEHNGATNEVTVPIFKSKAKSTRRKLTFDSENDKQCQSQGKAANLQTEIHKENHTALNLNLDSQATELCTQIDTITEAELAHTEVQNGFSAGKQPEEGMHKITKSMNQMPDKYAPAPPPAATKHNDALNAIARSVNIRCADTCQKCDKNRYSQKHQHIQGEPNRNLSQVNTTHRNLKETRQMIWQNTLQMVERNMVNSNDKRGSKWCAVDQAGPSVESQMNSPLCYQEIYRVDNQNNNHNFGTGSSETHKKRRIENIFHSTICSTPCVTLAKDDSKQVVTESRDRVYTTTSYMSQTNNRKSVTNFEGDKASKKLMNVVNKAYDDKCFPSMTVEHNRQKNPTTTEPHLNTPVMPEKRSSRSIRVHNITSPTVTANSNQLSSTPPKKVLKYGYEHGIDACPENVSVKRHSMESTSCKQVSSCTNTVPLQEQKDASHDYRQPSMKARGEPEKQQEPVTVDNITRRLQGLNISDGQENYALVPYKGQAEIVPYQPFDPIKKRKPRPKVDLDPETNRLWNLLMGKEGHEGMEAGDGDKEKWWEEERKIFRGRADSFIARMHLVQGDRRFSQWKGSVVDSVIGVFLTQNVSDHLSSSAFMSLAARFPLRSTPTDQTCYKSGTNTFAEEPVIQMLDPCGTINCYQKTKWQPDHIQTSITYHESSEHRTENPISGTGRTRSLATEHNGMAEEKASSSQNSSDSFPLQVHGEIQSCSGSNSGTEDSTLGGNFSKTHDPPSFQHTRRNASFQVLESHVTGRLCFVDRSAYGHKQSEDIDFNQRIPRLAKFDNLENSSTITHSITSNISCKQAPNQFQLHIAPDMEAQEVDSFGILREESISYLPSAASQITTGEGTDYMSRIGRAAERISKTTFPHNEVPMIQAPTIGHPTNQGRGLRSVVPHTGNDQISLKTHQRKSGAFALEIPLVKEPTRPTEAVPARQSGTRHEVFYDPRYTGQVICAQDRNTSANKKKSLKPKAVEANAKEQVYFSGETTSRMSTNMPAARKGKTEGEKRKSLDWDSLRKLVQPHGQRKERTTNTMDSLDYEAVRRADVNDISNAIKERGMNNMLAERMKDFLNRLVREHGSIDLEWLRDVPPDKAKDYLLSIRGLGLKSVECVRLLTLHHVAFPVDTNVGRIAVRLGWVPLQPLPESLQLHLLELYPMLESIQKYLWPRLYKLGQRTLYELHYQMITFGKVFCTKSKPNCNACPMRGECRHFASAFASARLALPGPEEKSMVSSTIPIAADKSPAVTIRTMLLPPAGSSKPNKMVSVVGSCEPIVEEPTTPELETAEVSQSDIEDAFYEDPDEIPTIKLNIQEFTQTLHQYMQETMELQENDMSKALVAINPEAASIPIPKLKNVSRLRTEHQVYELPDSHPLLNGMDKREPDDPSPYLLAIWTPGETANSIQPPERRCGSQESDKLCNEKTCFSCNSVREANSQTVRGTFLIPCRTAMRGSFPLNGTYFQVNEMFADHESSLNPIDVPRGLIWNLPRRTVYFGTSVTSIFRGLPTEGIQYCFWRGFVCVRGFDQKTRAPRPLQARFHFPASKLAKTKNEENKRRR